MIDEKEKDEVEEIFSRALERQDQQEIEDEENEEEEIPNTHNVEYIAPTVSIVLAITSLFDLFWFAAYFGILFSGIGIFVCKKKSEYVTIKGLIIYNILAFALSLIVGGIWIVMYLSKNLQ